MVVQKFIQAAPEINLGKWGHAVDAVSHRAGFVVCGDLEVAARMVSAEPVVVGGPQVKDKIKELVLYSISEEFFAVARPDGPDDRGLVDRSPSRVGSPREARPAVSFGQGVFLRPSRALRLARA